MLRAAVSNRILVSAALSCAALAPATAQTHACVWDELAPSPQARYEGPSLAIDGQLYMFGGFRNTAIQTTAQVDAYDPATDSWTTKAPMPVLVTHIGMALDDRTAWVLGGFAGDHPGPATSAVWKYDVDLDQWSAGPALPKAVAGGAAARLGRELHYYGGCEADRHTMSPDHFVLDLDNPGAGWSSLAPLPQPRCHMAGAELGGLLYAIAGQFGHDTNPVDQTLVQSYDRQTDTWTTRASMRDPRSHHETGTFVLDGEIVVTGGKAFPIGFPTVPDMVAYDPGTNSWRQLPAIPERLFGVGAQAIDDFIYITGGGTGDLEARTETYRRHKDTLYGPALRINSGGDEYISGGTGFTWCKDFNYFDGEVVGTPGLPIAGTTDDVLYSSSREAFGNLLVYRFPTDPGPYKLRVHLAEIDNAAPGARVMNVRIESVYREFGLDVAAEVGQATALVREYPFNSFGAASVVRFEATAGRPSINAIELIRLPDAAFVNYCTTSNNSTGAPAVMTHQGSSSVASNNLVLRAGPVPNDFGLFLYGQFENSFPLGHGTLCIANPFFRLQAHLAQGGVLTHALDLNDPPGQAGTISAGSTWNFQAWYRDNPAGGPRFNLSDGLRITFVP